jgi:cAMP-dependent protein kinase regulator
MRQYVKENFGNRLSTSENARLELEFLRRMVPQDTGAAYVNVSPSKVSTGESDVDEALEAYMGSDDSDSSDYDQVEDLLPDYPKEVMYTRRMSISAEVYCSLHDRHEDFKAPVYPKTNEQKAALKEIMKGNFMFSCLNPVEIKSVLDALKPQSASAGEMIIKQGDDGNHFYLVEQGTLSCSKIFDGDEQETELRMYK